MPKTITVITRAQCRRCRRRSGVGCAMRSLPEQGCDVVLLARNAERLDSAARECRNPWRDSALAMPTDVADAAAVECRRRPRRAGIGPIDTWVNVAMATVFAPVAKLYRPGFQARHRGHLLRPGARHHVGLEAHAHAKSRAPSSMWAPPSPIAPCPCSRSTVARNSRFAALPIRCARKSSMIGSRCISAWWICPP